jgi:hypothetical protein
MAAMPGLFYNAARALSFVFSWLLFLNYSYQFIRFDLSHLYFGDTL